MKILATAIAISISLNIALAQNGQDRKQNKVVPANNQGRTAEEMKFIKQETGWVRHFGGSDDDYGNGLVSDLEGNICVVGVFRSELSAGSNELKSMGGNDVFVAKLSPDGALLWVQQFSGAGNNWGSDITIDRDDNIYVTGNFLGKLQLGQITLRSRGGTDAYVAKLSPDGNVLWAKEFGGRGNNWGSTIAADENNNVYIGGAFQGALDMGSGIEAYSHLNGHDGYLAKFDASGNLQWAKNFEGRGEDWIVDIAAAGDHVYTVGKFFDNIKLGEAKELRSFGGYDLFVAKFSETGALAWAMRDGGSLDDVVSAATATPAGHLYITGNFQSYSEFGGTRISSTKDTDIFLVKYDGQGRFTWIRQASGSEGFDQSNDIATDATGNVYITGKYNGSMTFGQISLTAAMLDDVFAAKYSNEGRIEWVARGGGLGYDESYGITVTVGDQVYITGMFGYNATFGDITVKSREGNDLFIWQLEK